ncbi:MAG: PH domain-containing protein [Sporichthyaceae bacterium]
MPAGSEPLPRIFRPRRARITIWIISGVLLAIMATIAFLLPSTGFRPWSVADRIGVFGCGLFIVWFLSLHARVRAVADADGLLVVNMFKRRQVKWEEIVSVRFQKGDPWVFLDLPDGEVLPVMGIQGSDGAAGATQARELAGLVRRFAQDVAGR